VILSRSDFHCFFLRLVFALLSPAKVIYPLLFVVFTADIPEAVKGADLVLYADDTTGMVWAYTKEEVYWKIAYTAKETPRLHAVLQVGTKCRDDPVHVA
jgi:hypothetical protein